LTLAEIPGVDLEQLRRLWTMLVWLDAASVQAIFEHQLHIQGRSFDGGLQDYQFARNTYSYGIHHDTVRIHHANHQRYGSGEAVLNPWGCSLTVASGSGLRLARSTKQKCSRLRAARPVLDTTIYGSPPKPSNTVTPC
jgi:hypothetical protein